VDYSALEGDMDQYLSALIGGMLIGAAGVGLLLFDGRILGVSGIVGGLFAKRREPWRLFFLLGTLAGGFFFAQGFEMGLERSSLSLIFAGLLVGYGTRLGGGCTSGHGICGMSRISKRSIVATLTFMATGAVTVFLIQHFFGGAI